MVAVRLSARSTLFSAAPQFRLVKVMGRIVVYRNRPHSYIRGLATLLLLTVGVGSIILWRVQSVQLMTVQSASMAPAIQRGDAVILRPITGKINPGDVVSYRSPADQRVIITHRVVRVENTWKLIVTKGDNTSRTDNPVPMSALIGRVDARIAHAGYLVDFLRTPAGLIATVYAPAVFIILSELRRLTSRYRRPTYRLWAYSRARS